MKKLFFAGAILMLSLQASAQKLHKLNFKTVDEMYKYFEYASDKKVISGHRGTIENHMPENSIPSMKEVLKHTVAIFEIDPRLTKDSIPVMVHDATLDRTTTGTGKVIDYTWAELKKLKLPFHGRSAEAYAGHL